MYLENKKKVLLRETNIKIIAIIVLAITTSFLIWGLFKQRSEIIKSKYPREKTAFDMYFAYAVTFGLMIAQGIFLYYSWLELKRYLEQKDYYKDNIKIQGLYNLFIANLFGFSSHVIDLYTIYTTDETPY